MPTRLIRAVLLGVLRVHWTGPNFLGVIEAFRRIVGAIGRSKGAGPALHGRSARPMTPTSASLWALSCV